MQMYGESYGTKFSDRKECAKRNWRIDKIGKLKKLAEI